ncbi:glycosyl transferase [Dyadobacter arcticus]|uniref:Lipopolysaccharide biosynthesis glycosyltransferase n=1 Tax=Dyadobacter arcticus TaxID=1078754 RepID=A0ABX0ULM3_9BACT|nr:glycosyl transferase [Dyadobacter arcticus]NIJ53353.1 lipopolysaccharide biosynthesis glycosyltransferase [Dyadobacter arcticus]
MTIAFTICSINYLAQARTLRDSLKSTNPEILFFVGLVDSLKDIAFEDSFAPTFPMIEIDKIEISDFQGMADRYDITELNTAVKPFYFTYFFRHYPEADNVIYFDPDIIVFQPLTELLNALATHNAVLTPHIITPIEDQMTPNEVHHLNTGVYNLGFVAFRRSEENNRFIEWWEEKLRFECLNDVCSGLFVDQNWMNFLPIFVPSTRIERNPGYNAAYWNMHERTFTIQDDTHLVNGDNPLIFFHFSGYDPAKPNMLSKYQNRFELADRTDLAPLFDLYRTSLLKNGNAYYRKFQCAYIKPDIARRYQRIRKLLKTPVNFVIDLVETT